jgi:phosphoglycolate phosphatase-like HAD superfamily hydrolase
MTAKQLIVFDMDGVIIDVSRSYRETVRQAARLFFKGARGWGDLPDPLFPLTDLARVKQSGGLNNDWDLTCLILSLLFSVVKKANRLQNKDMQGWSGYQKAIKDLDVTVLVEFLHTTTRPLTVLLEEQGKQRDAFISNFYSGDVGTGNVIKQIFQEVYLGKALFEKTYQMPVKVYSGEGYINREELLIEKSILEGFLIDNVMAIATGRPEAEAYYALNLFDLRKYFSIIYTLDDCIREEQRIFKEERVTLSLSKPNPFMLDAIAENVNEACTGFYYVGDMPDDMIAASRSVSGFKGVGLLLAAPDRDGLKEDLLSAGADCVIDDFEELRQVIDAGKNLIGK